MSRPRFLADHDLNEQIVSGVLRQEPAIDFVHVRDFGMRAQVDDVILAFSQQELMLLVSHDVNTMPSAAHRRIAQGLAICGLIMVPQSLPVSTAIDQLVLIWSASELEEWKDQIVFLPL